MDFTLHAFSSTEKINATITLHGNRLLLEWHGLDAYQHSGDVVWPAFTNLHKANEIWRSTCFELFWSDQEDGRYQELNVSPSGAWNIYAFDRYRTGMRESDRAVISRLTQAEASLVVEIELLDPPAAANNRMRLGPCAILERATGELNYLACSFGHKPDFHDASHHVLVPYDAL